MSQLKDKIGLLFNKKKTIILDLSQFSWEVDKEETPFAYKYLVGRGFSDQEIRDHEIRVGHDYVEYSEKHKKEIKKQN